jgi:hypothetical protein
MAVQLTITWRRVVALLALVVVLPLAAYGGFALVRPDRSLTSAVDRHRYQAVVLSSGVVYFGHLREADGDFYELRDAFFIQEVKKPGAAAPTRSVLPLKNEVHGPENRMLIPRGQIVSVENLRTDSPVTKAAESAPK